MSDCGMTPPSPTPADAGLLLEHAQWMRRLAQSLVGDAERADELAQETWLRVFARPPRLDQPVRGWIATVMRNLVRAEHRGAARRAAREQSCARPEAEPSSHELVERAALQRELVQAVLELAEPYRATILLRYFEDKTPLEIAARERIPVATVKTRLARGLAQLRERLSRTAAPAGRENCLLALARLERVAAPPPLPLAVVPLAMKLKLLVPLALLALAGLAYYLREREADAPAHAVAAAPRAEVPAPELATLPTFDARREEAAPADAAPTSPALEGSAQPAAQEARHVRGRVIDVAGRPVAALEIRLVPDDGAARASTPIAAGSAPLVARSGPDGVFELPGRHQGRLFVRDARWTTLLAGVPVDARTGQECRVVVAPRLELGGVVLDADGVPLAGARVELCAPADLRARLAQVLDFSADVRFETHSDEHGRFQLEPAPGLPDGELCAEHEGFLAYTEPAPLSSRADLVLLLTRPGSSALQLRGRVLDPAGAPVEGARVAHGVETTLSDELGSFAFRLDDPEALNRQAAAFLRVPEDLVRAVKRGYLPAELRTRERDAEGRARFPQPLVLRLGGPALSIAGRVRDERGEPLAGIRVWLADPSVLGAVVDAAAPERGPDFVLVEGLLSGAASGWAWVESDDEGRFLLEGLSAREYTLAALDPATLLRAERVGVPAGRRDVELVLESAALLPRLAGRVVDGHGQPVPHLAVFPMCDALELRLEGEIIATHHGSVEGTSTDENGLFVLTRVPRTAAYLRLEGAEIIPLEWGRHLAGGLEELSGAHPEELVITVERRCHFQVELGVPGEADELGVVDEQGNALVISEFFGNARNDTERHPLREGRSSTLAVSDHATTLVLYRAGAEVRRLPLRLAPGEPTIVRP